MTWFAPLDRVHPELSTPISLAVSAQHRIVYVADSSDDQLVAIQMLFMPDVLVKVATPLLLESTSNIGLGTDPSIRRSDSPGTRSPALVCTWWHRSRSTG